MKHTELTPEQAGHRMISYIRQSRAYKNIYIHADIRQSAFYRWDGVKCTLPDGRAVKLTYTPFGRSRTKYKAHARYAETGKPVLSILLHTLTNFAY